jgi:hypothetical protein
MSHEQNLSSTSGDPEFVAQEFFEIPASEQGASLFQASTVFIVTYKHFTSPPPPSNANQLITHNPILIVLITS